MVKIEKLSTIDEITASGGQRSAFCKRKKSIVGQRSAFRKLKIAKKDNNSDVSIKMSNIFCTFAFVN